MRCDKTVLSGQLTYATCLSRPGATTLLENWGNLGAGNPACVWSTGKETSGSSLMKGSGHLTPGVTVACRVLQRLDGDGDRDGAVPLPRSDEGAHG